MLALVDDGKQPQRLDLKVLYKFSINLDFKQSEGEQAFAEKLKSRDHIVQGLIMALSRVDSIIELLRASKDASSAKKILTFYQFSSEQADSILALRLSRLTAMEEEN